MTDKFTPGPWKAATATPNALLPNEGRWNVVSPHGSVAMLAGPRAGHDARLIAAAPELLDLLRELVVLVWGECPSLLNEDQDGEYRLSAQIDAAIAKATGEGQ